jgi:ABC-type sulfate transport system permease component
MANIWLRFRVGGTEISVTLGVLLLVVSLAMIAASVILGWKGGR